MDKDALWLWFTSVFGFSSNKTNKILEKYTSPLNLFKIPEMVLMESEDFTLSQKKEIILCNIRAYERKKKLLFEKGIHVISIDNPLYPKNLKEIKNPPYVLYAIGCPESLSHSYPITMVGTRNPDSYGKKAARNISEELSAKGACIISGLAGGCDSLCHEGALAAGGTTIGVCACGIDVEYPKNSLETRREICENGCIISEFPPHYPVRPANFAIRNRILSGMSLATVIIQGKLKSGTMITANYAVNQNRDLYVLTGDPFNPLSEGPLSLLKDGASPFISSDDIIAHYENIYKDPLFVPKKEETTAPKREKIKKAASEKKKIPPAKKDIKFKTIPDSLPKEQKDVLLLLREGPLQIDELVSKLALPSHRLLSILTELELFSYVQALPGGIYKAL